VIWWVQIVVMMLVACCLGLCISSYRRQDAMQNMFLLSVLLGLASTMVTDVISTILIFWWAFFVLRAANFRTYLASLLGLATVAFYAVLVAWMAPDSAVTHYLASSWQACYSRNLCWLVLPLWVNICSAVLGILGLVSLISFWRRYGEANVRYQTRLLLTSPLFVLSLISVVFPVSTGSCLLSVFWLLSLYLPTLYVATFGFPRMPSFRSWRSDPYRRSYSRRSRSRR